MSCQTCIKFYRGYCLEWESDVPEDHRGEGCDKHLHIEVPEMWKRFFQSVETTKKLWLSTFQWPEEKMKVEKDFFKEFSRAEERLVGKGQKPLSFFFLKERVYQWCLHRLSFSEEGARMISIEDVANDCQMTEDQTKECLEIIYQQGEIKMRKEKKESLFWVVGK